MPTLGRDRHQPVVLLGRFVDGDEQQLGVAAGPDVVGGLGGAQVHVAQRDARGRVADPGEGAVDRGLLRSPSGRSGRRCSRTGRWRRTGRKRPARRRKSAFSRASLKPPARRRDDRDVHPECRLCRVVGGGGAAEAEGWRRGSSHRSERGPSGPLGSPGRGLPRGLRVARIRHPVNP